MKKLISRFKSPVEFYVLLFFFLVSLAFFIGSFNFTALPRIFPSFTSFLAMAFILTYSIFRIVRKPDPEPVQRDPKFNITKQGKRNVLFTYCFYVMYLIIARLFGFIFAVAFFTVLYPLVMGYRKLVTILICLAVNAGFVIVFQRLLSISLTRGLLLDLTRFFF